MVKKEIAYVDFDGNNRTETFYFQLMESEVIEFQTEYEGGLDMYIKKITNAVDQNALIKLFKKLILMSYGERSEDGRGFRKSEKLSEAFSQTQAFSNLFMELATDDKAALDFINGIMPSSKKSIPVPQDKLASKSTKK